MAQAESTITLDKHLMTLLHLVSRQLKDFQDYGYRPNNGLLAKLKEEMGELKARIISTETVDNEDFIRFAADSYRWWLLAQSLCLYKGLHGEPCQVDQLVAV
jgi:hypothetical protein